MFPLINQVLSIENPVRHPLRYQANETRQSGSKPLSRGMAAVTHEAVRECFVYILCSVIQSCSIEIKL